MGTAQTTEHQLDHYRRLSRARSRMLVCYTFKECITVCGEAWWIVKFPEYKSFWRCLPKVVQSGPNQTRTGSELCTGGARVLSETGYNATQPLMFRIKLGWIGLERITDEEQKSSGNLLSVVSFFFLVLGNGKQHHASSLEETGNRDEIKWQPVKSERETRLVSFGAEIPSGLSV